MGLMKKYNDFCVDIYFKMWDSVYRRVEAGDYLPWLLVLIWIEKSNFCHDTNSKLYREIREKYRGKTS